MLLPLLQRSLVGEGTLDRSGAVSIGDYERLKSQMEKIRAERRWRPGFLKNVLKGVEALRLEA